jgi:hypothetical protein
VYHHGHEGHVVTTQHRRRPRTHLARASRLRLSPLAWLPLVAALAVAAGLARAVAAASLSGSGGSFVMPAEDVVAAPVATRVRHVRQPRAPDAVRGRAR